MSLSLFLMFRLESQATGYTTVTLYIHYSIDTHEKSKKLPQANGR